MSRDEQIYVRLLNGGVGALLKIDSSQSGGKYRVRPKGTKSPKNFKEIAQRISKGEYDAHKEEVLAVKQVAKRKKP